jgi:DNA-binding transcriptional ArsR family regulator
MATCDHSHEPPRRRQTRPPEPEALQRAAALFRALGDGPRLRVLELLTEGEHCVTEIVAATGEKFSTVSQRLRLLRTEGLVRRRRAGTHLYYRLSGRHVADLIANALAHAAELQAAAALTREGEQTMNNPQSHHENHSHQHGPGCGHVGVHHHDHVDYLHDGHLHHVSQAGVEEHRLEVSHENPSACTPHHNCGHHAKGHKHGPGCGHEAVPHGDHTDYLVEGHLHHAHGDHCDDHGPVRLA